MSIFLGFFFNHLLITLFYSTVQYSELFVIAITLFQHYANPLPLNGITSLSYFGLPLGLKCSRE